MTLNQVASSIANHLNKPFNHELKERIKDSFKIKMALWIRRSFKEHGIDELLKISYISKIIRVNPYDKPVSDDYAKILDTKKRQSSEFLFLLGLKMIHLLLMLVQ